MNSLKTLAIIVNYKSADLTLEAVQSVSGSVSQGPIKVVVVDNSVDREESNHLRKHLPKGSELIVNSRNLGFGSACNIPFERFSSDCILLLNPDAKLLPGALLRMQKTLFASEEAGAVGPQPYWDDERSYYLPPSYIPALFLLDPLLQAEKPLAKWVSFFWRRYAIAKWRSQTRRKVYNLSGGHCLLKTKAVENAGGLFDSRFFLYFEDTDLFIRLRRKGYSLFLEPKAGVVHYYDQCAKTELLQKRRFMDESRKIFIEKYRRFSGPLLGMKLKAANLFHQKKTVFPLIRLPQNIEIPDSFQRVWLFEWSPNSNFLPAVGYFGTGPTLILSSTFIEQMSTGCYYGRIASPDTLFPKSVRIFSWNVS